MRPYPSRGSVRNASGEIMPVLGFVTYSVKIGDRNYDQEFIVIKQLVPEIILGRDFLSTYKLAITWGKKGVLELRDEQEIAILLQKKSQNILLFYWQKLKYLPEQGWWYRLV